MKKIIITILFFIPFLIEAVAPAVTDVTTKTTAAASSFSFTHTIASGNSNVDVFLFWSSPSGSGQPISATDNGGTMTCYDWNNINTVTGNYQSYCYITATTTGTVTMSVTLSASTQNGAAALTIKNVATGNPLDIMAVIHGSAATTTLTSTFDGTASTTQFADDLLIKQITYYTDTTGFADGSGEAQWSSFTFATNKIFELSTKVATTTGAYTMSSSWTNNNVADQMSQAIKAFVAPAAVPTFSDDVLIFE